MDSQRKLTLADLIDLELALAADREADVAALRRRDGEIAAKLATAGIDPRRTTGPRLFLAWLDELRSAVGTSADNSAGYRVQQLLAGIGLALAILGFVLGLSAVAAWLLPAGGRPINSIFFLGTVLGLQVPLLLLWVIAILPRTWVHRVPGAETVFWLWGLVAQLPPRIIGWLVARVSSDTGRLLGQLRGQYSRLSWIYGSLRLWLLVRLTQIFAVAFNLGLVAGFVLLSYGSDPAFGWKSTLMTENQMHGVTRAIATPWRWLPYDWANDPTREDIKQTRYWTLAENYQRSTADAWARWWPFLFASLAVYGLLPRLITLGISHWQVRAHLRAIRLDHSEFDRLAERLARPQIDTQATEPEAAGGVSGPHAASNADSDDAFPQRGPIAALAWAGVQVPPEEIERLVTARLGGSVAGVHTVGRLDPSEDARAVGQAVQDLTNSGDGRAALLVEVWEPPVGDYLDFIGSLRQALGRNRPICVLLYDRDTEGQPVAARESAARIWNERLAQLGDPWLRVDSLVAEEAA